MSGNRDDETDYEYVCENHCKLCPFPGLKCHGRPTRLNYENPKSPFQMLFKEHKANKKDNQHI